jgi:hypothetical protein
MKRSLSLFAAALGLALTATAPSQATPLSYTYNWSANPIAIAAGTGGVTLTNETPVTTSVPTDTAATNVTVFSAAPSTNPDVIPEPPTAFGIGNYTLTVTLTDNQGTGTGAVTFAGTLLGRLTHDSSNLTNNIDSSTDESGFHPGQTFGSTTFDGMKYVVSYNGFAAPGPEAQHNVGSISFHISFAPTGNGGGTNNPSPEPSSMVLGCLGLSFLGGVVLRGRSRKAGLLKATI